MKMCKKYGIPICSHFVVIYACQSVNKFFMKMSVKRTLGSISTKCNLLFKEDICINSAIITLKVFLLYFSEF